MKLHHGLHLAYCTNVHRGESWAETFRALETYALAVRAQVCPQKPFAIGLRLSERAAVDLSEGDALLQFQRWLEKHGCYVFTINGFPFGQFHGARVKEKVYQPDWTSPDRLAYTNLLFDLLAQIVPAGIEGSVSTVPGSFKEFITTREQELEIRKNIFHCVEYVARVSDKSKRALHLGLEPEPLCLLENSAETISFFQTLCAEHKNDPRLAEFLGVNYDCCHFAVEFEEPQNALNSLVKNGIKISKLHLSSALKVSPTPAARDALKKFADDVYFHQVIARDEKGKLKFHRDLPDALESFKFQVSSVQSKPLETENLKLETWEEWRIHFHVPLHAPAAPPFANTNDHLLGALDWLAENRKLCAHLEMETYTWEVLPPELKSRSVVEQLTAEYGWTLAQLKARGLA